MAETSTYICIRKVLPKQKTDVKVPFRLWAARVDRGRAIYSVLLAGKFKELVEQRCFTYLAGLGSHSVSDAIPA